MNLDFQRLRIFVAVAEAGGFSRAARALSMVQSAVSRQVQLFEEEVGLNLFRRNGRGVVLTEHGTFVLKRAQEMLSRFDEFKDEMLELSGAPSGVVTVALPPTLGTVLLGPLVQNVQESHPLINMRFIEGFGTQLNDLLEQSTLDLAVLYGTPRKPLFAMEHLFDEELYLVGPPTMLSNAPVSLAELLRLPLILPTRNHRMLLEVALAGTGQRLNIKFEIDSVATAQEMVRAGLGYTIQPAACAYRDLRIGTLRLRKFEIPFTRAANLVYPSDRRVSRATRVVAAAIKTTFRELRKFGDLLEFETPPT